MATTVQQRSRAKGWRKPEGSVIVDRTSRWGNWWRITRDDSGERNGWWVDSDFCSTIEDARHLAAGYFRADLTIADTPEARWILDHVHELAGKTLLCWCPQPGPCHAHVLAEMADASSGDLDHG